VLEVGCGTGTLTLEVAERVGTSGEVHGVDSAPEMIRVARKKNTRAGNPVTFQVGQIDRLPYPEGTFDTAICSFMIFHMSDDVRQRGLADIHRVLRDNGTLLVVDGATVDLEASDSPWSRRGSPKPTAGVRRSPDWRRPCCSCAR